MGEKVLFQTELPIDTRKLKLESVACPLCGVRRENYRGKITVNKMSWHLDYCESDEVWWVNPRPQAEFYDRMYQNLFYHSPIPEQFGYASLEPDGRRREVKAAQNLDDIEHNTTAIRHDSLLELGCASGELLEEAIRRGWKTVKGVEIETRCVQLARNKGIEVFAGSFEQYQAPESTFDLIFADNVIEHLLEPAEAIAKCSKMQRTGGYLVLRLPDTQPGGPTLKLLDHTYHFNRNSIASLLERFGAYEVTRIIHSGTYRGTRSEDRIENMTVFARRR